MSKTRSNFIIFSLVILSFLVFLGNAKFLMNHCLSVFNYGIFQQGVFELAGGTNLNPFMTVRGLHLFNDHFPLILFFTAPFIKLMNFHPMSLLIWEYLWFFGLVFLAYKKVETHPWLIVLMIVFSKGLLKAMELPGHPGVWPAALLFLIPFYLKEQKYHIVWLLALLTVLFRESYLFLFIGLTPFLFLEKKYKLSFLFILTGLALYLGIYKVRPVFLGEIYDYGKEFTDALLTAPISYIWERTLGFDYKGFIKTFCPYFIPLYMLRKNKNCLGTLLMISPLLFLHFLANKFSFQYGPMFAAPLLGLIASSDIPAKIISNKKLATLVIGIFIASSMGRYTKAVKRLSMNKFGGCETSEKKRKSSKFIYEELEKVDSQARIMATPGIIPRILKPKLNLYHPSRGHNILLIESFDYLIIERNETGGTLPLKTKDLEKIYLQCLPYASKELYKDHYYYMLKGNFPIACVSY